MLWGCGQIHKKCCSVKLAKVTAEDDVHGQDQVFTFYDTLTKERQHELANEFLELENEFGGGCEKLIEHFAEAVHCSEKNKAGQVAIEKPNILNWELKKLPPLLPGANLTRSNDLREKKRNVLLNRGFELYRKGHVAVVLLAGGLNSELAENTPTGMIDLGLLSKKSIFQLYAERVRRLQHLVHRKTGHIVHVPLYVMCNKDNSDPILRFFEQNDFFGLRRKDVMFFSQAYHPTVDRKGKMMLSAKHKIMQCPGGNGVLFRTLGDAGVISDMKGRGVTCVYVSSVDNVLAKIGDPTFVGHCDMLDAQCGVKCIQKQSQEEHLGIFCSTRHERREDVDGDGIKKHVVKLKPAVFAYCEMPDELRDKRNGQCFEHSAGNLSQYYFKVDFALQLSAKLRKPLHLIPGQLSYIDLCTGNEVHQAEDDSFRFETWIFDSFEHSSHVVGFEVSREEYALVKGLTGMNSPAMALQAITCLHQSWILKAGGSFFDNKAAAEEEDAMCEISPLVSYEGEDLESIFAKPIQLPFHMLSHMEMAEPHVLSIASSTLSQTVFRGKENDSWQSELELDNRHAARGGSGNLPESDYCFEQADVLEALPPTPRSDENSTQPEPLEAAATEVAGEDEEQEKELEVKNEDEDLWSGIDFGLGETVGRRVSKESILSDKNTGHLYGGAFSRNTGRKALSASRSKNFWMGLPGERREGHE